LECLMEKKDKKYDKDEGKNENSKKMNMKNEG
jgi:hypothetical protein